ncbi:MULTISPECIES: pentapeptide repeat-containing protein [unclassified Streptomyces]|uniref:pentapeptide repeat-containing protein n=1 Tax=unclassified Streptomyces TaxID=2593676 RepID=UPI002254C6DE|nr:MULTISPECIES: pentapeptide repeat-containing protein [unclassified Streptomyces]MCX4993314.1 pentapeptide repeat-containing protein [Streptomyces sp. NBC_00568]MCX5009255.1 pentapeptide repeat-containing protein [Streptomyces sp. NBC_00638]
MTESSAAAQLRRIARRRAARDHRRQRSRSIGPGRDSGVSRLTWVALAASTLPGLAALVALLFTWMSVGQTNKDLQISEQGQITTRFNAAITNLGKASLDVRLGGIYALQRIMQDSSRDQRTVVSVLSAFVRQHAPVPVSGFKPAEEYRPPTDVAAVVSVLGNRSADREVTQDGKPLYRADLSSVDLRGLEREVGLTEGGMPRRSNFRFAFFTGADLRDAGLENFDLSGASLDNANMSGVKLPNADLRHAFLGSANLTNARLGAADMTGADLGGANLHNAHLSRAEETNETSEADSSANLTRASLIGANLSTADLRGVILIDADLTDADLTGADLRGADLTNADLSNADLSNADLTGAKLSGAILEGARGLPPQRRGGSQ